MNNKELRIKNKQLAINNKQLRGLLSLLIINCSLLIVLFGCKEDDTLYVSMDRTEKELFTGEQYTFKLIAQGIGQTYDEPVTWSVDMPEYVSIASDGTVTALAVTEKTNSETGKAESFAVTIKAVIPGGRYALAKVYVIKREVSGMAFAKTDIYMETGGGKDSVEVLLDKDFLKHFPDLQVVSSNPELLKATLYKDESGEGVSKVYLETLKNEDGLVSVSLKAGDKSISCNVHVGVALYLSFSPIDLSLGAPTLIETQSFLFQINSLDTIVVYYRTLPDDEAHLNRLNFNVSSSGDHDVCWIKGSKRIDVSTWHIYVETSEKTGNVDVNIESHGKKITANVTVMNKENLQVKKIRFKNPVIVTESNLSLFDDLQVSPIEIKAYYPPVWTSSDESVATVDNGGVVLFKKAGEVDIYAQVKDSIAKCHITALLRVDNIRLDDMKSEFAVGETYSLNPIIDSNFKVEQSRLQWTSSNTQIATINNSVLTALAEGASTLSLTIADDKGNVRTAQKEVTVQDINLKNLNFTATDYSYYTDAIGGGRKIEVYKNNKEEESYTFYIYLEGVSWTTQNKTYTVGQEIKPNSYTTYNSENITADITAGTLVMQDGILTFDLTVKKGSKTATIKGSVAKD